MSLPITWGPHEMALAAIDSLIMREIWLRRMVLSPSVRPRRGCSHFGLHPSSTFKRSSGKPSSSSAAVSILHDALPPEFQIAPYSGGRAIEDESAITVHLLSGADMTATCGASALACAVSTVRPKLFRNVAVTKAGHTNHATVYFEAGSLTTDKWQTSLTLAVHELWHALDIGGHVDSIECPDSLMDTYGEFFPNPGYILHRIDREALLP